MATTVQLSLTLDSSGALVGVKQLGGALDDLGNKTVPMRKKGEDAFNGIESAERRAHTAGLLINRTLGVEMPRALENVIARSKTLGPLMAGLFNVSVFAAAGAAIFAVGEQIAEISQAAGGYTEAVKKMREETVKASEEAFINPKTLALTQEHLNEVNKEITANDKLKDSTFERMVLIEKEGTFWERTFQITALREAKEIFVNSAVDKGVKLESARLALLERETKLITEIKAAEAESKMNEVGLQGIALAEQQLANADKRINLGARDEDPAITTNKRTEAAAQYLQAITQIQRQGAEATISLRHQVTEDGLTGIAKVQQAESDAIDDINRKEQQGLVFKSDAAAQRVLIAKRAAEQERQAYLDIAAAQRDADLFAKQRAASFLQGSQKIIADAEIEKQTLINESTKTIEKLSDLGQIYYAWKAIDSKIVAVDDAKNKQLELQHQQLADKLKDLQEQAAVAGLPEWQRAGAQILLDRQKTYEEINRLEIRDRDNFGLYEAQKAAADQLANAKIRDEQKRMTEQLGSDLQSVFDDIGSGNLGKRILDNVKKLFFQIVAQWLLATELMKSTFGKIFGTLLGGPGSSLENSSGGGIGSLLGLLGLGKSSPGASAGAAQSGVLGSFFGGPSSGGSAGTGISSGSAATMTGLGLGALSGGPASSALTTQSISSALGGGPGVGVPGTLSGTVTGSRTGLGGLFSTQSLTGLGTVLPSLLGGKLGGGIGQLGGTLFSSAFMLGPLLGHLGISSAIAPLILGPLAFAGAGLLGFGIGSQSGKLGGVLGGGASGALMGLLVGGPIGALVGGIIGALGGIFGGLFGGSKRKKQANQFADQLLPQVQAVEDAYKSFQVDQPGAISQLEALRKQAEDSLKGLKGEGKSVLNKRILPAIDQAEKEINSFNSERIRRAGLSFGPAQFHDGGLVNAAMSAFTTRPGEMMALLKHGEFVVNPLASAKNMNALQKMNSGGSISGDIHINGPLIQANSVDERWLRNGGAQQISDAISRLRKEGR